MTRRVLLGLVACVAAACRADDRQPSASAAALATATAAAAPAIPASQYDIGVQLRRFQDSVGGQLATLADGAVSRDALVRGFVRAVEASDTAALARMQLTAREFASLYYPDNKMSRPPYELEPQLMWLQIEAQGDRGRARLLHQYGGKPLGFRSLECAAPERQGESLLHECRVRHATIPAGRRVVERLFGTILETHGRFKFVSYSNPL